PKIIGEIIHIIWQLLRHESCMLKAMKVVLFVFAFLLSVQNAFSDDVNSQMFSILDGVRQSIKEMSDASRLDAPYLMSSAFGGEKPGVAIKDQTTGVAY